MTFQAPSSATMVKGNRLLPDHLKQSAVLLTFAEPVRESLLGQFLRIHLTRKQKDNGEGEFWMPETFQPHHSGQKTCPRCGNVMRRVSLQVSKCDNRRCTAEDGTPSHIQDFVSGPRRGVVQVLTFPEFVVGHDAIKYTWPTKDGAVEETRQAALVNRCLLVLDRRYHPDTLAAVYRTAGHICDDFGWRLAQ